MEKKRGETGVAEKCGLLLPALRNPERILLD